MFPQIEIPSAYNHLWSLTLTSVIWTWAQYVWVPVLLHISSVANQDEWHSYLQENTGSAICKTHYPSPNCGEPPVQCSLSVENGRLTLNTMDMHIDDFHRHRDILERLMCFIEPCLWGLSWLSIVSTANDVNRVDDPVSFSFTV